MNERIELPIQLSDIECVSKCWIFNRLAIIKTSPYYRDWIASHFNLVATSGFQFDFENAKPAYYEEILMRKPVNMFQLTKQNIVDKLKGYLRDGYYVNIMLKPYPDLDYIHEIILYGFDDTTKKFIAVGIDNRIFHSKQVTYAYMEEGVERIQEELCKDVKKNMIRSLTFQYMVTLFKLNPSFSPENCVFEAYQKVEKELNGERYNLHFGTSFAEYAEQPFGYRYTGLCVLDIFKQMLAMEIRGEKFEPWFSGITSGIKTLVEHRQMMKQTLDYIMEKWKLAVTDNARTSVKAYEECSEVAETWLNLCLKYEITKDINLLKRIVTKIPEIYEREKECLETFMKEGMDLEKLNRYYI